MTSAPHIQPPTDQLTRPAALRAVLRLSAPVIPAMLAQVVINFSDNWFVSKIGLTHFDVSGWRIPLDTVAATGQAEPALAAVMPAGLLAWAVMSLFVGTVSAVSTFASQSLGRNEPAEAGRYAWQSLYFAAMTALAAVLAVLASPLLFAHVKESAVRGNAIVYFDIRVASLPAVVMVSALSAFFQGIHRPAVAALIGIGTSLLNLLLNWCLIFGRLGFPRWGVAGAAAASAASTVIGMLVLIAWFVSRGPAGEFGTRRGWRFSPHRLGQLVRVGLPYGVSFLIDMAGWAIMLAALILPLGEAASAASSAAMSYMQVGFMPVVGVGIAVTALVGKAIGQRRIDRARRYAAAGFALGAIYQLVIGLAMILFRVPLIQFFSTDPEIVRVGSMVLIFAGVFQVFDAVGIIYSSALRGAGDTTFLLLAFLVLIVGQFVPTSWALIRLAGRYWPTMQGVAPWLAATIYLVLLGAVLWRRWRGRHWEKIDIFGSPKAQPEHFGDEP